jgi:hypothetical protein
LLVALSGLAGRLEGPCSSSRVPRAGVERGHYVSTDGAACLGSGRPTAVLRPFAFAHLISAPSMSLQTASTSLPVLALPTDVLFPATQLHVNLPRALVSPLAHLIRTAADSGASPLVAAVPSLEPITNGKDLGDIKLHEWGCGEPGFDDVVFNA